MHFLISFILGSIFLFLLSRAIMETVIGLCQIAYGIVLHVIAFALDALAWSIRMTRGLWRIAWP